MAQLMQQYKQRDGQEKLQQSYQKYFHFLCLMLNALCLMIYLMRSQLCIMHYALSIEAATRRASASVLT